MDRRKFLKSASGLALMAAGALTGTSRVLAATDAMAATGKDKGRTGRQPKAERRNLGGMSVSPIGLGCLPMVGYYGGSDDRRHNLPRFTPQALRYNRPLTELVGRWARRKGITPAQFSLVWMLSRRPWIVPIPGTTSAAHLDDFIGAAGVRLTPDEADEFDMEYSRIDLMGHRADPFTESQIDK